MSGEGEEGMMMMMMAKNKVKFLCSHSGKILPRPPDGQLKYVGGETRVMAVPRTIDFSGLMEKLMSGVCEGTWFLNTN
ncbi:hypothetical protein Scep_002939 [Stephania cephalantha]|uniref:Uncharacterized protein n=1 Tax=Stephania cephalantha TaxID=152367 RepID=A0AAP0LC58_9MAGN